MSFINLDQATKMIDTFLDNPTKEQPRLLNKAVDVWSREYGGYVNSINESTPARVKMNIERLTKMQVKALGIVFVLEGTTTILTELIPRANGDTLANASKIAAVSDMMLRHLYTIPCKPGV